MSVSVHSLDYFLLASVASLASFGLCAIIVRAHKRVSAVMYRHLATSNRKKTQPKLITPSLFASLLILAGFVYQPESRVKGLHDSFSNLLS